MGRPVTCPNWISEAARSACTSSGKASLSSFCRSCQSTSVTMSSDRCAGAQRDQLRDARGAERARPPRTVGPGVDGQRVDAPSRSLADCAGSARRCPRRPTGSGCPGAAAAGWPAPSGGDAARAAGSRSRSEVSRPRADRSRRGADPLVEHDARRRPRVAVGSGAGRSRPASRPAPARRPPGTGPALRPASGRSPGPASAASAVVDDALQLTRPPRAYSRSASRCTQAIEVPGQDVVELLQQHRPPELLAAPSYG